VPLLFFYILTLFISAAVPADMTCKPLTSDNTKKRRQRHNRKHSSGAAVPLILGSNSEVMIRSNGLQVHDSPEAAPVRGTNPAERKSSTSTSTSPGRTYAQEVPAKNRSEVDLAESSDRNIMVGPALEAHSSSRVNGVGLPSLFDPDIPLTPSRVGLKEEAGASEAETNWDGGGLVPVVNNSDCKSTLTEEESSVDGSLDIENILEGMRSVPKLLSPMTPEPELFMGHGGSMYYLLHLCLQNCCCLLDTRNL
jgi:hypothetical protein